jgi:glutamate N-acetyltransferase/amino-acid N-acetyltransferase
MARELGCAEREILVCSTGVIGVPLDAGRITGALPGLIAERAGAAEAFEAFSGAIMTTDTRAKRSFAGCRLGGKTVRIAGCAKGAGMIHPQMATMLAFLTTDAAVSPALLSRLLRRVAERTFNAISVDGDTSTNDTVLLLASGDSGAPPLRAGAAETEKFERALERVCADLALQIVADGEGATHVVEIEVRGAPSDRAARRVAGTIATSPLVKTALAGADPNWGRILAAAGRAGVPFDADRVRVWMAGQLVCRRGTPVPFDEADLHRRLLKPKFSLAIDLGGGRGAARMWTCDITAEYVRINASYRT